MDIDDVKSKFGDKYDKGISEMETYTEELLQKRPVQKEVEKKREQKKKNKTQNNEIESEKCSQRNKKE